MRYLLVVVVFTTFVCSFVEVPYAIAQGRDAFQEKREAVLREMEPIWKRASELADAGRLKEAEATAKQAITRATALTAPNRPPVARGYGLLAYVYYLMGRYPAAEEAARQALSISEATLGANSAATGRSSRILGSILVMQGRFRESDTYLNRALTILQRDPGPEQPDTASALYSLARLRNEQGLLSEADKLARQALTIFTKASGSQSIGIARTEQLLGVVAWQAGRYSDAEAHLKQALTIDEGPRGTQHWESGNTLTHLGVVYTYTERFAEAELLLRRAIKTLETSVGAEHRATIFALRALGAALVGSGRTHDGELVLRRGLTLAEKSFGPEHIQTVHMLRWLGHALEEQTQFQEAEAVYLRALSISERLAKEGAYFVGFSLYNLGNLYLKQGRFAEAKKMLENALPRAENSLGREHPGTLNVLRALGSLDLRTNQPTEALGKLKRAAAALEEYRQDQGVLTNQRITQERGPILRQAVAETLAAAAWQLAGPSAEPNASHPADHAFAGAQLAGQSITGAAISQMAIRFAAAGDALGILVRQGQDLLQRWHAIDKQLTADTGDVTVDPKSRSDLRLELGRINKDLAELDRQIAMEFPQYAALTRPNSINIQEAQKLVGSDEALLVFLIGDDESFIWAIARDRFSWQRLSLGRASISEKITNLRKGLDLGSVTSGASNNLPLFDVGLAHELYAGLVGPVSHVLQGKSNLLVVPSGPLTSLPFHLLVTQPPSTPITDANQLQEYRNASWIINHHAITILPSMSSLKALRELAKPAQGRKPLVGFGDPALGPERPTVPNPTARSAAGYTAYWSGGSVDLHSLAKGLEPLPETATELRNIAKALGGAPEDIYLGLAATETAVKQAELASYRIVYFATHGLVGGEVKGLAEPALVLTLPSDPTDFDDGLLTASEVAQLKLDAEWVVLSACNTAAGEKPGAEALSGLARAFFYAGTRALLVSHWRVDSEAAARLTTGTFDAMQKNPTLGRAEALRRAMLSYMNESSHRRNAHPDYWGPFFIVGDGGR